MTAKNDGGPAFPCEVGPASDGHTIQTGNMQWMQSGMTMRDYFAAKAMQGELAAMVDPSGSQCGIDLDTPDEALARIAKHFYRIADAMLKAREGDCHE